MTETQAEELRHTVRDFGSELLKGIDVAGDKLANICTELIRRGDVSAMVGMRAELARLRVWGLKLEPPEPRVVGMIDGWSSMLTAAIYQREEELGARDVDRTRGTLRHRIVALLGEVGQARPAALADDLAVSMHEVSRALRSLTEDGKVRFTVPSDDRRGRLYTLTPAANAARKEAL